LFATHGRDTSLEQQAEVIDNTTHLGAQLARIQTESSTLRQDLSTAVDKLIKSQSTVDALEKTRTELDGRIAVLLTAESTWSGREAELTKALQDATIDLADQSRQEEDVRYRLQLAENDKEALTVDVESLRRERKEVDSQTAELEAAVGEFQNQIRTFAKRYVAGEKLVSFLL